MNELGGQEMRSLARTSSSRGPEPYGSPPDHSDATVFWPLASDTWRAELSRVIEGQILPRLLLAHSRELAPEPAASHEAPADLEIADFVERLIAKDAQSAWEFVATLQREQSDFAGYPARVFSPRGATVGDALGNRSARFR